MDYVISGGDARDPIIDGGATNAADEHPLVCAAIPDARDHCGHYCVFTSRHTRLLGGGPDPGRQGVLSAMAAESAGAANSNPPGNRSTAQSDRVNVALRRTDPVGLHRGAAIYVPGAPWQQHAWDRHHAVVDRLFPHVQPAQ